MNKALIIYHSKTGTTKRMGYEIADFCKRNGMEIKIISINEFSKKELKAVDYLFLGCWTHGHMIFNQHPDKDWVEFADKLPAIDNKRIVLFTTYKIATGSMFRKMKEHINCDSKCIQLELKSRNGRLKDASSDLLGNAIKQN